MLGLLVHGMQLFPFMGGSHSPMISLAIEVFFIVESGAEFAIQLMSSLSADHSPVRSLGGARLAFVSDRAGTARIDVINRFGHGLTRLNEDEFYDRDSHGVPWRGSMNARWHVRSRVTPSEPGSGAGLCI